MDTPGMHDFVFPERVARFLKDRAFDPARSILDLGCGRRKYPGAIGVDAFPGADADVTHDLNRFPYPFADGAADLVILRHVIEHLDDVVGTMREVARLLRPGGHAFVLTPHFSDASSWIDPTHRWHLATRSIEEAGRGLLERIQPRDRTRGTGVARTRRTRFSSACCAEALSRPAGSTSRTTGEPRGIRPGSRGASPVRRLPRRP
jgi:SAM-dependent methyltransferase